MSAIPERLKDRIREAGIKHVVDRPLAKVMIDAENCLLLESPQQNRIQRPCRGEVCPERLFDNDPSAIRTVRLTQLFHDQPKQYRRNREIVRGAFAGAKLVPDGAKRGGIFIVAVYIAQQAT